MWLWYGLVRTVGFIYVNRDVNLGPKDGHDTSCSFNYNVVFEWNDLLFSLYSMRQTLKGLNGLFILNLNVEIAFRFVYVWCLHLFIYIYIYIYIIVQFVDSTLGYLVCKFMYLNIVSKINLI